MRVDQALMLARTMGVDRLDAQLLLAHRLQQSRAWLLAHDDQHLTAEDDAWLLPHLLRRAAGEPLAYLLQTTEFCGLVLRVTPAVLIPRPETELLVDWAQELWPMAPQAVLVDLGTGSGAIALALKQCLPDARVTATDLSAEALDVARGNARRLVLDIEILQGDWWQAVQDRRFGLAVSNPPYIAGNDRHLAALGHEPRGALTPEGDGLSALRRIVDDAPGHLQPGAWLLLEHGHDQGRAVRDCLRARGFREAQTRSDLAGLARCTGAMWPASECVTAATQARN
jgi:release factor glutamine methyltransferase